MGTEITIIAQKKDGNDWVNVETPMNFDDRCYGRFGWLAGVRNYSAVEPLCPDERGLPEDFDIDDMDGLWGVSWLSMEEVRKIDFDQIVEDRRCTINGNGGSTCAKGDGKLMSLREFIGQGWVEDLLSLDADRIIYGFDS